MTDNRMIKFVETVLIPDITDRLNKGHGLYTFPCGFEYDANEIVKAVAERTNFVCKAMSATAYFAKH